VTSSSSTASTAGSGGANPGGCNPGQSKVSLCNAQGNDLHWICDTTTKKYVLDHTIYGCTTTSDPGSGTRVCPGKTFTRSCWNIVNGRARVDWQCQGSKNPSGGTFAEVDRDYCTATSGPETGKHFCPGEVIERDNCPGTRNYYICPNTQDKGASFVSHATLSCNVEAKEWEPLHRGLHLQRWTATGRRFRALRANLCDGSLRIGATRYADRGQTTSSWGSSQGMLAAINGGFYLAGYKPDGCVAFGGKSEWPTSTDTNYRSFIAFGRHANGISVDTKVEVPPYLNHPWMEEAVCGDATLVFGGAPIGNNSTSARARTGAGLSADRKTLYLLTVDENGSKGMTIAQFGVELANLGVDLGTNLDGGGSTTMWTQRLGVVNVPTAGYQRVVANHLGIYLEGGPAAYNCPTK
jgi:hypothetical protein